MSGPVGRKRMVTPRPGRSLISYLALPRPEEVQKWAILPIAFGLGVSTGHWPTATGWAVAGLGWFVVDYLLYSARYQWNDLRGAAEDVRHPQALARRRLPQAQAGMARRFRRLSASVAIGRVILAVALVLACAGLLGPGPAHLGELAALALTLLLVSIAYERLRSGQAGREIGCRPSDVAIWLLVTPGYAIRAGAGLVLAGVPWASGLLAAGTAYFAGLGGMFVLIAWALEAAQLTVRTPTGMVLLRAQLQAKPHLAALLRPAGLDPAGYAATPVPGSRSLGNVAILDRGGGRFWAPWNVALVSAALAGSWFALELAGPAGEPGPALLVPVALCVPLIVADGHRRRLLVIAVGAATLVALALAAPAMSPFAETRALLLWLAAVLIYDGFRSRSYLQLKSPSLRALE